jgi:arsenical pump membrane protein
VTEVLSVLALLAALAAAVARSPKAPDWVVALAGAALVIAVGAIGLGDARDAVGDLAPTVAFLAALLVLSDGCRRAGLFEAAGDLMARGARGDPKRLLAMVFLVASTVTAVLSLDATVVLLTPVVFATAARLRTSARPHVYACTHLANSASLLLPVSNLTNLLAFEASGLSFARFAALMVLPWLVALGIEWFVHARTFTADLTRPLGGAATGGREAVEVPRFALGVLIATLLGFGLSSFVGVEAVWVAAAGAVGITLHERPPPKELARTVEPSLLVFVLALGVVVQAASDGGIGSAIEALVPGGDGLPTLLAVAALSALVANLVNNLPATLIILPVTAAGGPGAVLAMLIGVNVGPNLTYVGSVATLLWRRVLVAYEQPPELGEFVRLGAMTVPPILVASTAALWLALQVL